MSAVDTVEVEVRELVRRRGLDPVADRAAVRPLLDGVVMQYDERTLTSAPTPPQDRGGAAPAVCDVVAGFGPLQPLLGEPTIEQSWIDERLAHGWRSKR